VVKSLEASLWAFHDAETFVEAVLRAVNLGDDADTTGAICGPLSARNRRFVARAAEGNSTSDLARMFQISKARISQMRRELASSWKAFCAS
jgi:hypothetical protein